MPTVTPHPQVLTAISHPLPSQSIQNSVTDFVERENVVDHIGRDRATPTNFTGKESRLVAFFRSRKNGAVID